jgi:hypothetical protein
VTAKWKYQQNFSPTFLHPLARPATQTTAKRVLSTNTFDSAHPLAEYQPTHARHWHSMPVQGRAHWSQHEEEAIA